MEFSLPEDLLGLLMILFWAVFAVLIIALMIVGLSVLIRLDRRLRRQKSREAAAVSGIAPPVAEADTAATGTYREPTGPAPAQPEPGHTSTGPGALPVSAPDDRPLTGGGHRA